MFFRVVVSNARICFSQNSVDFVGWLIDPLDVVQAMKEVAEEGISAARHLRGDIYEVRAGGSNCIYRVLFSQEDDLVMSSCASKLLRKKHSELHLQSSLWRRSAYTIGARERRTLVNDIAYKA
jgi:hypothetical protein